MTLFVLSRQGSFWRITWYIAILLQYAFPVIVSLFRRISRLIKFDFLVFDKHPGHKHAIYLYEFWPSQNNSFQAKKYWIHFYIHIWTFIEVYFLDLVYKGNYYLTVMKIKFDLNNCGRNCCANSSIPF